MGNFDIWLLLAGVGLLLFGMNTFEDGLKVLAGKKMKYYLEKYTQGAMRSVTTGSFVTSVLQSSSLISLLLLGFVGAGVMALPNAIGVIIGANIGTTLGALYVALLGFGEFSISAFAMPIVAVGGILMITAGSHKKRFEIGKLLIGFGLLFIGIGYMKDSVETLRSSIDFAQYANMALWKFGLLGMIVTLIIQSSSATGVLTFTALASGLISFEASIAIVMGANIGTTATSVLASLGGKVGKRQLALAQVLFNVISGVIGIIFFWQYISLTGMIISIEQEPIFANAILNAIFNVSTALLFAPFLLPFTRLIQRLVPDKVSPGLTLGIDSITLSQQQDTYLTADIMLKTATDDVKYLVKKTIAYNTSIRGIDQADLESDSFDPAALTKKKQAFNNDTHRTRYEVNQEIANSLFNFLDDVEKLKDAGDTHTGNRILEQAILNCIGSMKHIKNVRHNIQALNNATGNDIKDLHTTIKTSELLFYRQLTTVISRKFTTNNITELDDAMTKIKALYADNIDRLASLGKQSGDTELDTPSLINTTRELYDSSIKILEAVSLLYLTKEEKQILEKVL